MNVCSVFVKQHKEPQPVVFSHAYHLQENLLSAFVVRPFQTELSVAEYKTNSACFGGFLPSLYGLRSFVHHSKV